jgi:hypothetical protein
VERFFENAKGGLLADAAPWKKTTGDVGMVWVSLEIDD